MSGSHEIRWYTLPAFPIPEAPKSRVGAWDWGLNQSLPSRKAVWTNTTLEFLPNFLSYVVDIGEEEQFTTHTFQLAANINLQSNMHKFGGTPGRPVKGHVATVDRVEIDGYK